MTVYAKFSSDGFSVHFYHEDLHGPRMRPVYGESTEPGEPPPIIGEDPNPDCLIPADAIEITDGQWQDWLQNPGRRRWTGSEIAVYDSPAAPLSDIKAALKAQVDAAAERERARYITPGAGQAMTYQAKVDEARRLAGDPSPDAADYPLLSAEVGITAPDLASVGDVVLAAYQAWQVIGAAIEGARLSAKQAIDLATDEAGARAAAEVVWPA